MRVEASRELLASRGDVWRFVAEPHHLPDWWPGIGGVQPDRRGLAAGARWQVRNDARPRLLRRPSASDLLLVRAVRPPELFAWQLRNERLDVELRLEAAAGDRTRATLSIRSPWLFGLRRSLPRVALRRLHDLCQTAASL
jgi:uncharacterized protein YndB with AHSA1/START domain